MNKLLTAAAIIVALTACDAKADVKYDPVRTFGQDASGNQQPFSANSSGQETHTLDAGENQPLNKIDTNDGGNYKQVTATGFIKASAGALVGFFVASSTNCTVQLHDDPDSATAPIVLNTTTTLAVGWYPLPATFGTGLYFTEGGTCDITFVYH